MNRIIITVFLFTFLIDFSSSELNSEEISTLKLVHVIFRHGNRTPDRESLYPNDPNYDESNYKEGYGQLTIEGKRKLYQVGLDLRKRYDKFLTDTWNYKYINARSSEYTRAKMSLQLVLAALYPPNDDQMWSSLKWQPIPYEYVPLEFDKEIAPTEIICANRTYQLYTELLDIPEISKYLMKYNELRDIIQINTNITNMYNQFLLYYAFSTQYEIGLQLVPWASTIYPEPLTAAYIDLFYLYSNTTTLRRLTAGYLLKKILHDTAEKINGTIEPIDRKMFLYSGHDYTLFTILRSLDTVRINVIPPYGSYVLFEIHEINGVYGIKIFYQFYETNEPIAVKLPDCDYFCPYDQFYQLIEHILPESDDECNKS